MVRKFSRKSLPEKIIYILIYLFMIFLCVVCIAPILHVFFASISDPKYVMSQSGIILWPQDLTLEGYKIIFRTRSITHSYLNTLIYVGASTAIGFLVTVMAAYPLSRKSVLWRNVIMMIISFTMLFNGGMITFYMVIKNLGMYNTRWAIILPGCASAFNLILVRTSMMSVPQSLEESAKLDGAGPMTILFRIYLPLVKPTLATIILYMVIGAWNSWFNASIFLTDRAKYPLQLVLQEILMKNDVNSLMSQSSGELAGLADLYKQIVKYCCIMVSTIPVLVFYPFVMKYFKSGIMLGSIKG